MAKEKMITWDDITVDMFERMRGLTPKYTEGDLPAGDELSELERLIKILSIVTGVPEDVYLGMTFEELNMKAKLLAFLYEQPKERFTGKGYTLGGRQYVLAVNAANMCTAQYIDYMRIMRARPDDVVGLLSTVIVPKGMPYNEGYDMDVVKNDIRHHLPYVDALGISFFFAKASELLMRSSQVCLVKKLKRQTKRLNRMMMKETDAVKKAAMLKSVGAIRKFLSGISSSER